MIEFVERVAQECGLDIGGRSVDRTPVYLWRRSRAVGLITTKPQGILFTTQNSTQFFSNTTLSRTLLTSLIHTIATTTGE